MFSATRRWLRKNRTPIAIGAAVIGGTYLVGQYVVGKLNDARERSQLDKIAKDKYVLLIINALDFTDDDHVAFEDDSNRIKLTAR